MGDELLVSALIEARRGKALAQIYEIAVVPGLVDQRGSDKVGV